MLLPQLCFNRWHESDGVRLYSQDTWQQVMQGQGPSWLARCLPQVILKQPWPAGQTALWLCSNTGAAGHAEAEAFLAGPLPPSGQLQSCHSPNLLAKQPCSYVATQEP